MDFNLSAMVASIAGISSKVILESIIKIHYYIGVLMFRRCGLSLTPMQRYRITFVSNSLKISKKEAIRGKGLLLLIIRVGYPC
jgi:hypothetical protein